MVYDHDTNRSEINEDIALASDLLSSGVLKSRVKEIFKNRIREEELENILDDSRVEQNSSRFDSSSLGAVASDIERLVEEAKAPEDFVDPLYSQLMRDPVVMSSGYVVDRNTILDREGNLLFSRCPFSGKRLSSTVYPVEQKKKQIEHFRMKRDSNITQMARKLIAEGRFKSFHDVLDAIEVYMKGIGGNYLPLVRELAAIWSGTRNHPSTMLLVDRLKLRPGSKWTTAVESGHIEEKVYKILVSADNFRDQGRGSHRSSLALSLYDNAGELVERCKLFDDPYNRRSNPHCIFGKQDGIVASARIGYTYKLQYMLGSSPQHVQVEGLICKIIPSIDSMTSYRMRDADGEEGLYIGSTNVDRNAHGEGSLEYEDGKRFVGKFQNGSMVDGVLYRGSHIRHTLKRGKWTKSIDDVLVEKYPSNVIVYDQSGSIPKSNIGGDAKTTDDYSSARMNGRDEDSFDDMLSRRSNRGRNDEYSVSRHSKFEDTELPFKSKKSLLDDESYGSNRYSRAMDYEDVTRYRKSDKSVSSGVQYPIKSKSADEEPAFSYMYNGDGGDDEVFHEKPRHNKYTKPSVDDDEDFPDVRRQDESKAKEITSEGIFPDVRRRGIDTREDYSISHQSNKSRLRYEEEEEEKMGKYSVSRGEGDDFSRFSNDPLASSNLSTKETAYIDKIMRASDEKSYQSKSNRSRASHHSESVMPFPEVPSHIPGENEEVEDVDIPYVRSKHSIASQKKHTTPGENEEVEEVDIPYVRSKHSIASQKKHTTLGENEEVEEVDIPYVRSKHSIASQKKPTLSRLSEDESYGESGPREELGQLPTELRPHIMHVPKLQKKLKDGGKWLPAITSGYLENYVKSLVFSVDDFVDTKLKCNLGVALYNETGQFVARCIVFRSRTKSSKGLFHVITSDQNIVSKAKPGYFYQLQYAVDSGHQDLLKVKGWMCKIFSGGDGPLTSYYMADKDGDYGYYFGPVNNKDQAHGNGYLEYENGCTFVGKFANGQLLNGAYYKVNQIQATMKDKKWTQEINRELQHAYPQKLQIFKREVQPEDIDYENDDSNKRSSIDLCCV